MAAALRDITDHIKFEYERLREPLEISYGIIKVLYGKKNRLCKSPSFSNVLILMRYQQEATLHFTNNEFFDISELVL